MNVAPSAAEIFGRDSEVADPSLELRIVEEMDRERARREARRRLAAEDRGAQPEPQILTLRERLARPRPTMRYRIDSWQPVDSRVMLSAQFKAGKTTIINHLLRTLADDDPFLGTAPVEPLVGNIAVVDTEMSEWQADDWLRDQRIQRDDRIVMTSLRGKVGSFDLLDLATRAKWAAWLRDRRVEYVVLDCLRPVLDALNLDEHRDGGRFLVAFDALLAEAGIREALVVQHMGHVAERARGDSRLRDWPDVEWRLVRRDDDPASPRYLSAFGRDVDVPESALSWDGLTRRLTLVGGSRRDAKIDGALDAILDVLRESDVPLSGRAVKAKLIDSDHPRDTLDAALSSGVRTGALIVGDGPRNSRLYRPSGRVSGSVRPVSGGRSEDRVSECPAGYIEPDTPDAHPTPLDSDECSVSGPDTHASCCEGGELQPRCKLCKSSPDYWQGTEPAP